MLLCLICNGILHNNPSSNFCFILVFVLVLCYINATVICSQWQCNWSKVKVLDPMMTLDIKVIAVHPEGNMNVCTKFCTSPSSKY